MNIRFFGPRLLLVLAALMMAATLFGQTVDSNLVGTVNDSSGSAVPGATVTLTNKDTGVKYAVTSGSSGEYRFNNIPVGSNYEVSASARGFATAAVAGVILELNHTASVNLTLAVGTVTTTVEVTEASAMIDTSTSQLQNTFNSMQAVDLPSAGFSKTINGAGIYNLSLVGAGVASSGGVGQGTGPSVAGQRPENNTFMIDGVPNNNGYSTGPQEYISNEVIASFNVAQNQFSAEFGGASGGVFNAVVKTGTNSVHGNIFEYFQNRKLNAIDYKDFHAGNTTNPRFDQNRLGATVGGPIIKDKLFYFGSYEYNPLGQASTPGNAVDAPTQAGIALLNGMSGLNKTNLGIFEKYVPVATTVDRDNPSTTVNGVTIPLGALTFASPNYTNSYHAVVAIDYNISEKDQLRGRWIYDHSIGLDNNATLPIFYTPNPDLNNGGSISEFHNFSPTMENEFRISYRRNVSTTSAGNFSFPNLSAFPNLSFDDLQLQLGPDPNAPQGSVSNTASLQDNLTKTWGKHTFKAGYQLIDVILAGNFVQRVRGDYDYTSLEEYLLDLKPSGSGFGTPNSGERSAGFTSVPFGDLQHAAFFQDDWRVNAHLTLNLGLRYEYVTVPVGSRSQAQTANASVPGVITFASPKSGANDWQPRIGFAYSPGTDGKWVVRGGVGRAFDNTYINLNQNAAPLYYFSTNDVTSQTPLNNFLTNGGLSGALPPPGTQAQNRANLATYTWDMTRPYALIGTIGVQHIVGKDYTVEARYTYTKGVHLWNQTRLNVVSPVSPTNSLPTYFTQPTASQLAADTLTLGQIQNTLLPGTTTKQPWNDLAAYGFTKALVGYHPWGNSKYNGLALQVTKRYSNNFMYIVAYTWSHSMDDSTATNFSTIMSPRRTQDFQNNRLEWANSALDRRHRLTITPVYDFKPFQNGNWLMKNVVGNWNVSGTYTFQSPEYATVEDGIDANLNQDATGDRPVVNPAGQLATVGSGVNPLNAAGQIVKAGDPSIVAYVAINPSARYVQAGSGAHENAGRNTLSMYRTNNFDVSLKKVFNITERFKFDVGAQAFNLLNHSQFTGGYLSDVTPYQTNTISNTVFQVTNKNFGAIQQFFPSNSRQLQLVAHFTF